MDTLLALASLGLIAVALFLAGMMGFGYGWRQHKKKVGAFTDKALVTVNGYRGEISNLEEENKRLKEEVERNRRITSVSFYVDDEERYSMITGKPEKICHSSVPGVCGQPMLFGDILITPKEDYLEVKLFFYSPKAEG